MPKIFDPLADKQRKGLDTLKCYWDEMRRNKQAYTSLLVEPSEELSAYQIADNIGLSRQRVESQLRRAK